MLPLTACDVEVENEILGRWIYTTNSYNQEYWIHFYSNGDFDLECYDTSSGVIEVEHSGHYTIDYANSEIITYFVTEDEPWKVYEYNINPYMLFNRVSIKGLKKRT